MSWSTTDRHPRLAPVVLAGGLGALTLAMFGLPPVDLHSPLHQLGIMDPLCGMTRAVRFFARGDLSNAWRYNPGSFALAFAAVGILVRAVIGRITGGWLEISIRRSRLTTALVASSIAALWINQQLHSALLR